MSTKYQKLKIVIYKVCGVTYIEDTFFISSP